jgi:predicted nucleotidyltransferase
MLCITATLDGDVLAALANGDVELSGRELARRVGHGSTEGIRRAADRLVTQGTVLRRAVGGAHLYRLNREHLAARYVEGLANLRRELIERLRSTLDRWAEPPRVALLFGSVARGDANVGSDLDLLIVRACEIDPESEPWRTQLLALQRDVTAWTGNDTRVLEYAERELGAAAGSVFEDILADGVELYGSRRTLKRLLADGMRP